MKNPPNNVKIVEVGPRDGLQFEPSILTVDEKVNFIKQLAATGLHHIEVGSFVSPEKIPQLANSDEVICQLDTRKGITYTALVPNGKGMQRAIAANIKSIAVFTAASETFCQKNIGCSIDESFTRFQPVFDMANQHAINVRGYISCICGCPYEGKVDIQTVTRIAERLYKDGCKEISLGDTIGVGTPFQLQRLVKSVSEIIPIQQLAVHLHDTRGQALANIVVCLESGVTTIDASVAGLGGCPYAKGASGNVATEDLVYMLHGMGINTGINLKKLIATGIKITRKLQTINRSKVATAGIPQWLEDV